MIEQCLAQSKSRSLSKTQVRDLHHVKALVCHALGAKGVKGMKAEAAEAARQVALKNATDADDLNLYARLGMDGQKRGGWAKRRRAQNRPDGQPRPKHGWTTNRRRAQSRPNGKPGGAAEAPQAPAPRTEPGLPACDPEQAPGVVHVTLNASTA